MNDYSDTFEEESPSRKSDKSETSQILVAETDQDVRDSVLFDKKGTLETENEFQGEQIENQKTEDLNEEVRFEASIEEPKEETHSLRISIDVHAVKELPFQANIYVQYKINLKKILNAHAFKSHPPVTTQKLGETSITNGFSSYEFKANKSILYPVLTESILPIEVYHFDRFSNNNLV